MRTLQIEFERNVNPKVADAHGLIAMKHFVAYFDFGRNLAESKDY